MEVQSENSKQNILCETQCNKIDRTQTNSIDRLLSVLFFVIFLPLLLVRSALSVVSRGKIFDYRIVQGPGQVQFKLLSFAGQLPGRRLAVVFNLLRQELRWLGPPPSENYKGTTQPGVFSPDLRTRLGMVGQTEVEPIVPGETSAYLVLLFRAMFVSLLAGKRLRPAPDTVRLFGFPVRNDTMKQTMDWLFDQIKNKQRSTIFFMNAHCFNIASKSMEYQSALRRANRLLPDGSGVRLACRFLGFNMKDNLNGTDLFPHLCQRAVSQNESMFLLGAAPGVAEQVAVKMQKKFPGLKIAGIHHGYFKQDEDGEVVRKINRSGASILLIAMGVPQQELWLSRNVHNLSSYVNLCVGGLFDFYSERISRAPSGLRELGLEWVWRLLQEPGRMWQRYIVGNPEFVIRAWRYSRRDSAQNLIHSRKNALVRRIMWRLRTRYLAPAKRLMDILAASLLLIVTSPILLITTALIRLETPGPVLFTQTRIGRNGKPFQFIKFRSMYANAEEMRKSLIWRNEMQGGVLFKIKEDPRITRVGRFIRRYSIDELPQLWNVLRGDMSLVGPRPALPHEVEHYTPLQRQRLLAVPGLTCIWQVSGRSTIPFERQVDMDLDYIHKACLKQDIELILKTIPAVLSGRGAY